MCLIIKFVSCPYFTFAVLYRLQFLTAEETPEEPPPVTDSATLKHFAREAEVTAILWWLPSLVRISSAHLWMVRGSRVIFSRVGN